MRWWRSLTLDGKIGAVGSAMFLALIFFGMWVPHDEMGSAPW